MVLRFQTKRESDESIFGLLEPELQAWFRERFSSFTEPQRRAIPDIHKGKNVLISAPTGTGKTLSAFTAVLNELMKLAKAGSLSDQVYCVYVSPLRALNNDIEKNLREPLSEILLAAGDSAANWNIRVSVRTGDTSPLERSRMLKHPPHILITTPETLSILLSTEKFSEHLKGVRYVVVDEIHSLAGNKRGVHLALSLERLERLAPNFVRVGLSATVAPLTEVASFLVGMKNARQLRDCLIVDVPIQKKLDLQLICPVPDLINASPQQIQTELYALLHSLIQGHKTTLVFTNTRAATERVVHHLRQRFPDAYSKENIDTHHSSVSREQRIDVENRLKRGELRAVVTSTSLELGIDIGYIDLVVLLGSPKSVANALQRIGRAGHRLHDTVKGRIVVLDRDDLIECALLRKHAMENKINKIRVVRNSLDVLAQHVFGECIYAPISADDLFRTVCRAYPYKSLSRKDFDEVVAYLSGKFSELEKHYVFAKIGLDPDSKKLVRRGKMARVLYMTNAGTIPDEAKIKVKLKNDVVGTVDEGFIERLHPGDVFILGGKSYRYKFTRGNTVQVELAEKSTPTVPQWVAEALPLSFELALAIQDFREKVRRRMDKGARGDEIISFIRDELSIDENAAVSIWSYLDEQQRYLELPHRRLLLIEFFEFGFETHCVFHSLFGRRINEIFSRLIAHALQQITHRSVNVSVNDNGFLLSGSSLPVFEAFGFLQKKDLFEVAREAVEESELFIRRFRHCATRSFMILRSYKGRQKSVGRQQMNARLLLHTCRRMENDFFVLRETRSEILTQLMDLPGAIELLKLVRLGSIEVREVESASPSPFALNLFAQGHMDSQRVGEKSEFIRQLHEKIQEKLSKTRAVVSYY